jgi:hypothetical protein
MVKQPLIQIIMQQYFYYDEHMKKKVKSLPFGVCIFLLKMNNLNLEDSAKLYYYLISLKPFVLSTAASLVLSYKSFLLFFILACFNSNSKIFFLSIP